MVMAITWTMNVIIKQEYIPQSYRKGVIISIPKSGKDSSEKGNNRGITLLPALYKLLERIMMQR